MTRQSLTAAFSLLSLISGFAGQVDTQTLEHLFVHRGEDDGGMDLAAPEFAQLLHGQFRRGIGCRADGQGDQHLVGVEPGIPVAQMLGLQVLDGVDDHRRDQMQLIPDAA